MTKEFQSLFSRQTALASPENVLEMRIAQPYSRPTKSETLGVESSDLFFNKPSRWF